MHSGSGVLHVVELLLDYLIAVLGSNWQHSILLLPFLVETLLRRISDRCTLNAVNVTSKYTIINVIVIALSKQEGSTTNHECYTTDRLPRLLHSGFYVRKSGKRDTSTMKS